jgi:hypothetical protein
LPSGVKNSCSTWCLRGNFCKSPVITRAIEKHYEELLGEAGASGYEYLDKIVQIPFQIPHPTAEIVTQFIRQQMKVMVGEAAALSSGTSSESSAPPVPRGELPRFASEVPEEPTVPSAAAPVTTPTERLAFSLAEHQAFAAIASELRPNPRHLKRLINVYRLVRALAQSRADQIVLRNPGATVRWLVISAQWPCIAYAMLWQLDQLLEQAADEGKDPAFPAGPVLPWLYEQACATIAREEKWRTLRDQLDDDPAELKRLILKPNVRINWKDLTIIRRYTIHFNPAVEAELRLTRPSEPIAGAVPVLSPNGSVALQTQPTEDKL